MTDPDRRALSHMSPEVLLVHLRLEVWGRWAKDPNPGDWPERTILAKLIEEGPGASASTAKVPEIPPGIAETDRAVAHLAHDETLVIKTYYLHWAPMEILAKRARMPPRRFQAILSRARWRLVGWFTHP